jgi:predicted  nucleic acid-binding Zn-ribbon protein
MNSIIRAPISVGELIDKITILKIKLEKTQDENKLKNISQELNELLTLFSTSSILIKNLSTELQAINSIIWEIEDQIRIKERTHTFDQEFIDLARSVYIYNDRRAVIKRQINELSDSFIVEEKIY